MNYKHILRGGTAVYKILNHMNRFSEDIDITVKVNVDESKFSNRKRLKDSAKKYSVEDLELVQDETIDVMSGSITTFYKYDSLFSFNELFKSERVQVESTSFTVSEPVATYTIEPLVYKYATDEEKQILKKDFNLSEFTIGIIKLERIFFDKVFAAEYSYNRKKYGDVAKHLYDISILMKQDSIKRLLSDVDEMKRIIGYIREEEKMRKGGVSESKKIKDFENMKLDFDDELINAFNDMQRIYVLDDESRISLEDMKASIKKLYEVMEIF